MSVSGPLARTVADAAAMLNALAVPVPGEPYPLLARAASYLAAAGRPGRLRIGRYAEPPVRGYRRRLPPRELPVSVQLVGRAGDDALLLALGAQLEAAAGWTGRRPPVW